MRVLEIGCGPGAMAHAIAARIGDGHILAIDRSTAAIRQARAASRKEIQSGRMRLRQVAIEDFELGAGQPAFDMVLAIRVGTLDGRHPEVQLQAHQQILKALAPGGRFFIAGGRALREVKLRDRGRTRS